MMEDIKIYYDHDPLTGEVHMKVGDKIYSINSPQDILVRDVKVETVEGQTHLLLTLLDGNVISVSCNEILDGYIRKQMDDYAVAVGCGETIAHLGRNREATFTGNFSVNPELFEQLCGVLAIEQDEVSEKDFLDVLNKTDAVA